MRTRSHSPSDTLEGKVKLKASERRKPSAAPPPPPCPSSATQDVTAAGSPGARRQNSHEQSSSHGGRHRVPRPAVGARFRFQSEVLARKARSELERGARARPIPPRRAAAAGKVASAALWAALVVGLQLWAAMPAQAALLPPAPALELENSTKCQPNQYYDRTAQMCCSLCKPGEHVRTFCTATSDTVCDACEDGTYTELWNWVPECFSCDSPCSPSLMEAQTCTRKQNRMCTCKPGWYCTAMRKDGCRFCTRLRKCPPGFGVARPGNENSNVVCTPCGPGTFSNTTSSTDTCRPHRNCSVVAIPGNANMDTVCKALTPALMVTLGPVTTHQAGSTRPQPMESTPGPDTALSTFPLRSLGPSLPVEELSTGSLTLPIGLIVGVTAVGLLAIVLVNCIIMTQRKKKPSCLHGEAKVSHLLTDKARGAPGREEQQLLTTAPSSSSSSLESSANTPDRRETARNQSQAPDMEKTSGAGATQTSGVSSAVPSPSGYGTQVNVTCIVNVCSSSDHGSQCPSQTSSMSGDMNASPSGSPEDEEVPFSKEERPFQSQLGALETLQQSPEEKSLPLGVPDVGMKSSSPAGGGYVSLGR
ncbi:PREDICTED: tumor necrosis factor receptor superfamily member 1B [Chrysochloris asiatica]|uniref:Tumor necrosis factor receptor superfamily member 1B n=1 Tax=Chrysochloris asiatica TaxID=185453 RepID=A0A9B0TMA3_CHRAS|nr:PREDICTED: tumor necrosis factor receptor superfamily member 1B [Chrysochloris asiatica]